jgi:hypothetical protein
MFGMSDAPQSHSNWITKNQKSNPAEYGRYARKAVQPQVIRVCIVTLYVSVVSISVQHIPDYKTGLGVAILLTATLYLSMTFRGTSEKVLRKLNGRFFDELKQFEFQSDGYLVRTSSGSYSFNTYASLHKVQEENGNLIIYLSPSYVHFVPKSTWPTEEMYREVTNHLKSKGLIT